MAIEHFDFNLLQFVCGNLLNLLVDINYIGETRHFNERRFSRTSLLQQKYNLLLSANHTDGALERTVKNRLKLFSLSLHYCHKKLIANAIATIATVKSSLRLIIVTLLAYLT